MDLGVIKDLRAKMVQLNDIDALIFKAFQTYDVQSEVIELNHQQLNDYGIDANSKKMETLSADTRHVYSLWTIKTKLEKGQPYDKVTLYDTGRFQDSFKMVIHTNRYEITANFDKKDGSIWDNLDTKYEVLGLTDENINELAFETILPIIDEYMRAILNK